MIDFNVLIDKHLKRDFKPKQEGRYYPSEIGNCIRKVWYSYKYPQQAEPELVKVFEVGNILHDFIVEVLGSEKTPEVELIQSEIPFKIEMPEFLISGRVDDLLLIKERGEKYLVEVKSTKMLEVIREPQAHHLMQLNLYMHYMGVENGILLYIEKSSLKAKQFEIPYNNKFAEETIERFHSLHSFMTSGKTPPPEAKQVKSMNWMCNYCEYRERCDGE